MRHELLTILFIRSSYKIRKFNMPFIYYRFLKLIGLLFLLSFIALIVLVMLLYNQNQDMQSQLQKIKQDQRDAFLNGKGPVEKEIEPDSSGSPVPSSVTEIDSQWVDIRNIQLEQDHQSLNIQLELVNITAPNRQIQGFLFIALKDQNTSNGKELVLPQAVNTGPIQNITDYTVGDSFSIKYFKMINYLQPTPDFAVNYILFRVYSGDGQIIYQKVKPVDNSQK